MHEIKIYSLSFILVSVTNHMLPFVIQAIWDNNPRISDEITNHSKSKFKAEEGQYSLKCQKKETDKTQIWQ